MRFNLILFAFLTTWISGKGQVSNRYELVKMDKTINTFHHEAAPVVSPDGKTLYFFVQNHPDNTMGKEDTQDIWVSRKSETGQWSQAEHMKSPFNIHRSNQVFTVFEDGSLFIRGGSSKGEKGFSMVQGTSIRELNVKEFKNMNKGRFYGASMSADKKHIIIYFSEQENSANSDLYLSDLQPDGSYSKPVKLKISVPQDDVGPFISPDQKSMYYASGRLAPGRMGGVDIYKVNRLDDTWASWSEPQNLGKPVNTSALDFYFTIDAAGNVFTSRANKAAEGAQLDIFIMVPKTFHITINGKVSDEKTQTPLVASEEVRPAGLQAQNLKTSAAGTFTLKLGETRTIVFNTSAEGYVPKEDKLMLPVINSDTIVYVDINLKPIPKKLLITGRTLDAKTGNMVPAKVEVFSRKSRKTLAVLESDGGFEKEIPETGWYVFNASAEGYLNLTDSLLADNNDNSPFSKDLELIPIEVGVTVRLKNIYFDFDRTTLKKESFVELNKVVAFLKQNKSVAIEIAGHTDSKGSDEYNLNLSQGRSQAVVDYLISQGIATERLKAHGYGETVPLSTNDTDAGRANNRRVEFTILSK